MTRRPGRRSVAGVTDGLRGPAPAGTRRTAGVLACVVGLLVLTRACSSSASVDPGTAALDGLRAPGEEWSYDQTAFPVGSAGGRAWGRSVVREDLDFVCAQALDWLAAAERRLSGAEPDSGARGTAFARCTDPAWLGATSPLTVETDLGPPVVAGERRVQVRLTQRTDLRGSRVVVVASSSPLPAPAP